MQGRPEPHLQPLRTAKIKELPFTTLPARQSLTDGMMAPHLPDEEDAMEEPRLRKAQCPA